MNLLCRCFVDVSIPSLLLLAGCAYQRKQHYPEQVVRLLRARDVRVLPNQINLLGSGFAKLNDGSAFFFWNSSTPPRIQLSVSSESENLLRQCGALLQIKDLYSPPVEVIGDGTFTFKENDNLGIFNIVTLKSCSEVKDK